MGQPRARLAPEGEAHVAQRLTETRGGAGAENFAVLRHLALHLLQQQKTKRLSTRGKRLKAAWDNAFPLEVRRGD